MAPPYDSAAVGAAAEPSAVFHLNCRVLGTFCACAGKA